MDKFPEAFRRFEQVVNVDMIESFSELRSSFELWAGDRWKDSPLQREALRREARRLGLRVPPPRVYVTPTYRFRFESLTRRGKSVTVCRDVKTGRFVKRP